MKKTRADIGGDPAELLADAEGEGPSFLAHQMMEPKLEDFGPVLVALIDSIELGERLAGHTELCVAAGRLQLPFELHGEMLSTLLARWITERGSGPRES